MKCTNCGKEIKDGVKFCSHCGYSYNKTPETMKNGDEKDQTTQDGSSFVKYVKYAALAYIAYLLFGFFFGNSHKCVGRWEGSFLRPSDSSTRETWVVKINSDGSCEGSEIGSGSFDYEVDYTHGEWHAISDDVIYVELTGDAHTTRTTYSNAEVDKELAKAQTPWAKHEAYKRTSGTKLQVSSNKSFFYLRRDGTISSSMDFSYPRMVLSKR